MNVYVATGNTYPHRELFQSWAWHWDAERRAWIEDNGSEEDEPCIVFVWDLTGVSLAIEKSPQDAASFIGEIGELKP